MNQHTVFGDLRQRATAVYRVKTRSSQYLVGFHELRGRRFVIVRGEPGTDREAVVVRDSDPRVGDHSMFELPITEWPGKVLEVATMTSSPIESVSVESDPEAIASVGNSGATRSPWARPVVAVAVPPGAAFPLAPPGMSESPAIVPVPGRGTRPQGTAPEGTQQAARQVVVGQAAAPAEPEVPYPERHVRYAESVAQLLRSIARRDRLFEDLATRRELRERLRQALDDSATLLEQIRRRDRA